MRCTLRYNPELGSMPAEFCTFESLNHVYTGSKIIPPSTSHRVPDRPSAGRGTPHGLVYYFPYSYIARFPAFLALYMYLFYFILFYYVIRSGYRRTSVPRTYVSDVRL